MARIPQAELERLKREVDLVALVTSSGVKLDKKGNDLVGLCPLHDDKTPSLVVTPSKNLWNCLGACGTGGTVIDWVMKTQGVSFRHAVEILRSGESLGPVTKAKRSRAPRMSCPITEYSTGPELIAELLGFYHQELLGSTAALEYLERRGINDKKVIETFRLGFVNSVLGYRLPESKTRAGRAMRKHLRAASLTRPTGHEYFAGSLVIPVFDARGDIVEIYGRRIIRSLQKGTPRHLYLPGPHRGIFNLDALRESKEIILCESLIDALTFWCAGYHNVTSSFGTNGFTDEMLEGFKAFGTQRVLIAYDRDEAGEKAVGKLAERLAGEGLSCFRVQFPHNMDANEYAQKVQPAQQSLGVLLRSAEWIAGPDKTLSVGLPCADAPAEKAINNRRITVAEPASSLVAASGSGCAVKIEEVAAFPASTPPKASPAPNPEPATPVPELPRMDIPAEVSEHQVVIRLGDRFWRIRGLAKNLSYEQMRVNVFVTLLEAGERFHQDTLDIYSAKQRQGFIRHAAVELGATEELVKKDLGNVLLKLEQLQEEAIRKTLEAKEDVPSMTAAEREAALKLLKTPALLDRIADDFERCGVVGERINKLVAYLTAVSRKLTKPLAVMVQSSSAAGKSALLKAVLAFLPSDEFVAYSAMTGQSLFYMGETDLKHKVLAIAEEDGAEKASYALKLLQSEGELTIASTGKDPKSGRLTTHEYHVEGPTAILTTTTAIDLDEELLNRCIVLTVDESREQTQAIHQRQREEETLEGYLGQIERKEIIKLHQNAQRLLRSLPVINPFAKQLTFLDAKTRTRRDHLKYLALIRAIALIHQHQRPIKTRKYRGKERPYIEVTISDIAAANELAAEVLGRTLDELPPQTRRFLLDLDGMVAEACETREVDREALRFTARQIRENTGWGATQVKVHLRRLIDMEYLLVYRASRGQGFVYELLYEGEGQQGEPFVIGLIDVKSIKKRHCHQERSEFEAKRAEQNPKRSPRGRPEVGGVSGGCRTPENGQNANGDGCFEGEGEENPENALIGAKKAAPLSVAVDHSRSEEESSERKLVIKLDKKSEEAQEATEAEPDEAPETGAVAAHGGRQS